MSSSRGNPFGCLLVFLAAAILAACGPIEPPEKSGELVIGILAGPTTYQDDGGVLSGFEHDLLESFAASLKIKTRYVVVKNQGALLKALRSGRIHLAAGLPINADPELVFSEPIREAQQVLVGNVDDVSLATDSIDLSGHTIEALTDTPQLNVLRQLAGAQPRFTIRELVSSSERDLLQRVAEGKVQLVATDSLNYSLALNYFPDLVIVEELAGKIGSGWGFVPINSALVQQANIYIATARRDGSLARLHDRYFGHVQRIKPEGIASFIDDIHTRLPRFRTHFFAAQAASGLDWRLIAALAYQESKWDPLATSYTNVRGMMMLTEETADRLDVDNRLDPAQSIRAGADYLASLTESLPEEIHEPDRTWLALAAYNLGMGHLNGARTIAKQLKRDSTSWYDMKKVLPLMSRPEYYTHLKSGPARGGEAVIMVENIRNYFDILKRFEPAWQPTPKLASFSLR